MNSWLTKAAVYAIVVEILLGFVCSYTHWGITSGGVDSSQKIENHGFGVATISDTVSFLWNAMTFNIESEYIILSYIVWICNLLIILQNIVMAIALIQAIGTWIP
jgi:hypothetical protein